ncbi:C39 family peptidase [Dactylosporangium sp. CA-092794]|uniref:C39 family peptidase n=1 Tax=Dactylosporangium sp. CA-092794 TaxID=3239929 RepID=UPI003D8F184B
MPYLYKPRHSPTKPTSARRLPIAAASAVLAVAAGVGVAALQQSGGAATTATAADAQSLSEAESSAGAATAAELARQRGQAPPDPAKTGTKGGTATTGKPTAAAKAAPTPAATTAAAAPSPSAPASTAPPAQKDVSYQFAWQENYYFCGPAATRIALTARGLTPSQSEVAQKLGTTVNGTNSADDTTRALNGYLGTSFYKSHFIRGQSATQSDVDQLRADLVNAISQGYAVVANIAGSTTDENGHAHSYPDGHFLTVVGYRDNGQIAQIADPADALGVGSYPLTTAKLADWIALRGYSA